MSKGIIIATLKNPNYQNSELTINFPITDDELSEKLTYIGFDKDCITADCIVGNVEGAAPVLKCLIGAEVNVDELNYLAKRLDSFWGDEFPKFSAVVMAEKVTSIGDLINLTFNMGNYTLVKDFNDLEKIGLDNYMDIHQYISVENKGKMDFESIGRKLVSEGNGKSTPYGVVYCNEQHVDILYDGRHFPDYAYTSDFVFAAKIQNKYQDDNPAKTEWLYLPCSDITIKKALNRINVTSSNDITIQYDCSTGLSNDFLDTLNPNEALEKLNEMCVAIKNYCGQDTAKLEAIAEYVQTNDVAEITRLAEHIDIFDFAEGITNHEQYGKYIACKELDVSELVMDELWVLKKYIDFESYGKEKMVGEDCGFTSKGFVECYGDLDEILEREPLNDFKQNSQHDAQQLEGIQM